MYYTSDGRNSFGLRWAVADVDDVVHAGSPADSLGFSCGMSPVRREAGVSRLAELRGQGTEFLGTYRVIKEFTCHQDGQKFPVGSLIDRSLVGDAYLGRLTTSRSIRPLESGTV